MVYILQTFDCSISFIKISILDILDIYQLNIKNKSFECNVSKLIIYNHKTDHNFID